MSNVQYQQVVYFIKLQQVVMAVMLFVWLNATS
jgi:hypothetical protein